MTTRHEPAVGHDPAAGREPAAPVESTRALWWILAAAACAIVWRAPVLWWEPRFWGEEGGLYFAYARQQGILASLFFVPTSGFPAGYLLLAASLPTTLASFVPLEWAPRVTTTFAGLVQLAPIAVVLFLDSPLWRARTHKAIVVAALVFAPAVVGEVWLNTINSQVFCGLTAALILVSRAPAGRSGSAVHGLLVFCGLSGPYTAFLAPLFWLRTRIEFGRQGVLQWRIVLATAVLQASVFLWTTATFPLAPERFESGRWALRGAAAVYHVVIRALCGETLGLRSAEWLGLREPLGSIADAYWDPVTTLEPASPWVGVVAIAVVAALLLWLGRRADPRAHLLTVAVVLSGALITVSTGHLFVAGRYAVVPGTLLLVRVAVAAWDDGPTWRRASAAALLGLGLVAGVVGFRTETPPGTFGGAPERPTWTHDVATWRQDPGTTLRIWPYNLDVQNRLVLSTGPRVDTDLRAIEAAPFRLTSTGTWATWRLPAAELPDDFRLVLDLDLSRPVESLELELRWLGPDHQPLATWSAARCPDRSCRITLHRYDLPDGGPPIGGLHGFEVALRSPPATPTRLTVDRLRMARRLEGALEPLLVAHRASGSQRRPLAGEATAWAMVESWRVDRDFAFDSRDLDRVRQRWAVGSHIALRRDGERLAYRGSHLHALLGSSVGGERGLVVLNLIAMLAVIVLAERRGVAMSLGVPILIASWAGVRLFGPGASWILALVLWIGLTVDLRKWLRDPRLAAVATGGLAAVMVVDSPIVLPLALVVAGRRWLLDRSPRAAGTSFATAVLILAAAGLLVGQAGGLPWWARGDAVVVAPEAWQPDENRPLVMPASGADDRGLVTTEATLRAIPDLPIAPLFAYPVVILAAFLWLRRSARRGRWRIEDPTTVAAVLLTIVLAGWSEPIPRVGPPLWAALYPLILTTASDWPRAARRWTQGLALVWCLAVLRAFL